MNNIFFTADTHFGHKNIIRYCNRPFVSIEEHDDALIDNWNSVVHPKDIIYHLGDFCFGGWADASQYISRLYGNIKFIFGSHDKALYDLQRNYKRHTHVEYLGRIFDLNYDDTTIVLCHYCMTNWPRSHYGTYHLYGHTHGNLPDNPHSRSIDVGVDCNNYYPFTWDQIKELMSKKLFVPINKRERVEDGGVGLNKIDYAKLERKTLFEQLKKEFEP